MASKQFWQQSQKEDPVISALIKYATTNQRPPSDTEQNQWLNIEINEIGHKIAVDDGLLYYYGSYKKSPLSKKLPLLGFHTTWSPQP